MYRQPATLRRCAACDRWQGPRAVDDDPTCVRLATETDSGLCQGGPWDGSPRRARAACGRWLRWRALAME